MTDPDHMRDRSRHSETAPSRPDGREAAPARRQNGQDRRRRRSAARLAAVQALYQQSLVATPPAKLMAEFHSHRFGEEIDGDQLTPADKAFFDDIVSGVLARHAEIDAVLGRYLNRGWTLDRLDRLMLQILRAGTYELLARPDVPRAAAVSEYADVADAFYGRTEVGFVNAILDRLGRQVRDGAAQPGTGPGEPDDQPDDQPGADG